MITANDKLKIGVLCHPTYGGSGVVASELAISLAEAGHSVHLFSHEVPPRLARSHSPVQMHRAQGIPCARCICTGLCERASRGGTSCEKRCTLWPASASEIASSLATTPEPP